MASESSDWLFTHGKLEQMSGSRRDHIAEEEEQEYRQQAITFMTSVGRALRLPQLTLATASVFFSRFFMKHSMRQYDHYLVSLAALFLASKVEESLRKLRDIIKTAIPLLHGKQLVVKEDTPDFKQMREKVLLCERIMLQTLNFDLSVTHPYKYLLNIVRNVGGTRKLAESAWKIVNDSLRTRMCLMHHPELIARSAIVLGAHMIDIKVESLTGLKEGRFPKEEVDKVANAILDLYQGDKKMPVKQEQPVPAQPAAPHPLSHPPGEPRQHQVRQHRHGSAGDGYRGQDVHRRHKEYERHDERHAKRRREEDTREDVQGVKREEMRDDRRDDVVRRESMRRDDRREEYVRGDERREEEYEKKDKRRDEDHKGHRSTWDDYEHENRHQYKARHDRRDRDRHEPHRDRDHDHRRRR